MNPAFIANIVQLVVAAAQEIPELVSVIENAIAATRSGTGPTNEQIASAVAQAQANNAAVQGA